MKKVLSFFVIFMMFTSVVVAASVNGNFEGNPIVKLKANGQEIKAKDVPAIIYNGRTMVPIYMLEELGFDVSWDQKTYSVNVKQQSNQIIDDLSIYIAATKKTFSENGINLNAYNASIDEGGLFFYAKYNVFGLQADEIIRNLAIISSMPVTFGYDSDGTIFEIYHNGEFLGAIAVNNEDVKKFVNNEIELMEFASTWMIQEANNKLNIIPDNFQSYNQNIIPSPAFNTPDIIESKIDGDFEGWEGDTIFKLTNGQIWQQASYDYLYHYAYMPDVLIYKDKYGNYKMRVEGVDEEITVIRIK